MSTSESLETAEGKMIKVAEIQGSCFELWWLKEAVKCYLKFISQTLLIIHEGDLNLYEQNILTLGI